MITAQTTGELVALFHFAPELKQRYAKTLKYSFEDFQKELDEGFTPVEMRAVLSGLHLLISQIDTAAKSIDKILPR